MPELQESGGPSYWVDHPLFVLYDNRGYGAKVMPYPFQRVSQAEMRAIRAKIKAKKAQRAQKVADTDALGAILAASGQGRALAAAVGLVLPKRATGKPGAKLRKIPAKTLRKRLVAQLDSIYSLVIRKRDNLITSGKCVLGCGPIECVSHLITRSKYSVRWDLRNGVGACHSSNLRHEFDPHPYTTWFIRNRGLVTYETLVRDSNKIAKFSNADLESKLAELKTMMGA